MRLTAISTVVMLLATCGVTSAASAGDAATAGDATPADLPAYMEQMSALVDRCREAATLADDGRPEEAIRLLRQIDGLRVGGPWPGWQRQHAGQLERPRDSGGIDAMWFVDMGRPDIAAEVLEKRRQQAGDDDGTAIADALLIAKCWADVGRYARAREVLNAVPTDTLGSDWREILSRQIESMANLRDDQPLTVALFRKLRDGTSRPPWTPRLPEMVRLWGIPADTEAEHAEKAKMLAAMFAEAGPDHLGERLALTWLADRPNAVAPDAADALLVLANKAYEARRYDEAAALWRRVERQWPNTPAWGKAAFNLGLDLKRQRKHDEAIAQFGRLLVGNVDDREAGAHIMENYRNYRPRAQWEIGQCLLAKGDHAGALAAFRMVPQKYPFQTWCGNEADAFAYRQTFYEGVCLEHLGRHGQAAANYYRATTDATLSGGSAAALRLVELYAAAGQLADLRRVLDDEDARHARAVAPQVEALRKELREQGDRPSNPIEGIIRRTGVNPQTRPLREILALRDLEAAGDWAALAARVKMGGSSGGAVERHNLEGNYLAVEAARLLARHPDQAVPHLVKRLGSDGGRHDDWIWYALGRCGTAEAVAVLKAQVASEWVANWYVAASLAHALGLAGDAGRDVLAEVIAQAKRDDDRGQLQDLQTAAQRLLAGELGNTDDQDGPTFPAVPERLRLPPDPRPEPAERANPANEGAPVSTTPASAAPASPADAGSSPGSSLHRPAIVAGAVTLGVGLSLWRTRRRRYGAPGGA